MNLEQKFLKKKFQGLHASKEVVSVAKRTEARTGEKVSQKPVDRIENYMNRFQEILDKPEKQKEISIKALKKVLFENNVIKEEDVPERVYELEQEIVFNQGYGRIEITEDFKEKKNKEIISGQEGSLSSWIDYLSSDDAMYPMWAKYWAMRSILKVGKYNKEKKSFDKRGKDSVAPFPPMNVAAVAKSIAVIQEKINNGEIENFSNLTEEGFKKVLNKEAFAKIYALALESMPEFSEKGLENIKGEWVVYKQISRDDQFEEEYSPQVKTLFDSLQGYPLEWCTAGNINTANNQLKGGDFHVYYSENDKGEIKIPRVVIRLQGNSIAEIRGIEVNQNMDEYILPVVEERMNDFGKEGIEYQNKIEDMEKLTEIYNKFKVVSKKEVVGYKDIENNLTLENAFPNNEKKRDENIEKPEIEYRENFNKNVFLFEELEFVFQVKENIKGFGYKKDPRIEELQNSIGEQYFLELAKKEYSDLDWIEMRYRNEDLSECNIAGAITEYFGEIEYLNIDTILKLSQKSEILDAIVHNTRNFGSKSKEIIFLLLEKNFNIHYLIKHLHRFSSLDKEVAKKIFEDHKKKDGMNMSYKMIDKIYEERKTFKSFNVSFFGTDNTDFVFYLMSRNAFNFHEDESMSFLNPKFEYFEDLDESIAIELMKKAKEKGNLDYVKSKIGEGINSFRNPEKVIDLLSKNE